MQSGRPQWPYKSTNQEEILHSIQLNMYEVQHGRTLHQRVQEIGKEDQGPHLLKSANRGRVEPEQQDCKRWYEEHAQLWRGYTPAGNPHRRMTDQGPCHCPTQGNLDTSRDQSQSSLSYRYLSRRMAKRRFSDPWGNGGADIDQATRAWSCTVCSFEIPCWTMELATNAEDTPGTLINTWRRRHITRPKNE